MFRIFAPFLAAAAVTSLLLLSAVAVAVMLPFESSQSLLDETGPIEQASIVLWLVAALAVHIHHRFTRQPGVLLYTATFLLLAMREADLHRSLAETSFFKLNFYTHGAWSSDKLFLGILALAIVAITGMAMLRLLHFIALRGGWKTISGQIALLGLGLLATTKIADRLSTTVRADLVLQFGEQVQTALLAYEETGEMLVAFLFCTVFLFPVSPLRPMSDGPPL